MSQLSNILIGNAGAVGQTNTTMIGDKTTHTATYIGGIYNKTVGATQQFVVIDANDKLGSVAEPVGMSKFLYIQQSNVANATGNGDVYTLGTSVALTKIFDANNDMTTGGLFTAPATGYYNLTIGMCLNNLNYPNAFHAPHQFGKGSNGGMQIVVTGIDAKTYTSTMPWNMSGQVTNYMVDNFGSPTIFYDQQSSTITYLIHMTRGDIATFNGSILSSSGTSTSFKHTGIGPIGINPFTLNTTFVSGFQVP